jgi:hypothetical protein
MVDHYRRFAGVFACCAAVLAALYFVFLYMLAGH